MSECVQKIPPLRRIVSIAMAGMRVRLGRTAIALGGICLSIAYVVSIRIGDIVTGNMAVISQSTKTYDEKNVFRGLGAVFDAELNIDPANVQDFRAELIKQAKVQLLAQEEKKAAKAKIRQPTPNDLESGAWNLERDGYAIDLLLNSDLKAERDEFLIRKFGTANVADKSETWKVRRELDLSDADKQTILVTRAPAVETLKTAMQQSAAAYTDLVDRKARIVADELAGLLENNGLVVLLSDRNLIHAQHASSLWITAIVLIVAVAGIMNSMLMSVSERFREIGTMKCLGALDSLILALFLFESAVLGMMGSILGILSGAVISMIHLYVEYGWAVWPALPREGIWLEAFQYFLGGVALTVAGSLGPAYQAARMAPVAAMRVDQ